MFTCCSLRLSAQTAVLTDVRAVSRGFFLLFNYQPAISLPNNTRAFPSHFNGTPELRTCSDSRYGELTNRRRRLVVCC